VLCVHPAYVNDRINRRFYWDDAVFDVPYPEEALLRSASNWEKRERHMQQLQDDPCKMAVALRDKRAKLSVYRATPAASPAAQPSLEVRAQRVHLDTRDRTR